MNVSEGAGSTEIASKREELDDVITINGLEEIYEYLKLEARSAQFRENR
jgi:imidazoleglycerol-phosphate dehydratase/histidinol-phosphatase